MNSLPTIFKIIFALSIFGSLFSKQIPLQRVKTIPNIIFNNNVAYKVDEETPYTGKISILTEGGVIKSEGLLRDGIKSGLWKEFFSSGQIKSKGIYRNDMKTGVWADWYNNDQKQSQAIYRNGQKNGKEITWYKSGIKKTEINYKSNKK